MLDIKCVERMEAVKAFAERMGAAAALAERLEYLAGYACHGDEGKTRCEVFSDFAPNSFSFNMLARKPDGSYTPWFNGGLIYYGPREGGAGAPQFSVSLSSDDGPRWEIHT